MSATDCHPGQRWISNTEPELGLGIVYNVSNRRVEINFPAGGEHRTYVLDNAPLTRVKYRVADRIRSEDGTEISVSAQLEVNGCVVYRGLDARGEQAELHEADLDSYVQFNRPLDRLFTGQIDSVSRFRLRRHTLALQHRHRLSPAFGLLGPRVQLLPHQFYIADAVSTRHAPRVLLADEVGLGKTIEAGLILHRLLLNGRVTRALIVLPDNLVHQWMVEMLRRFNLHFSIVDAGMAAELSSSTVENPFESAQLVIAPISLLTRYPERLEQAVAAPWDMLIVDEAHHLEWSETAASREYLAVEQLAAQIPGLLLLTATPEQLGVSGHFARLNLLDSHRYPDLSLYLEEERRYAAVSTLINGLMEGGQVPDAALREEAAAYLGADRVAAIGADASHDLRGRLVRELLDHHGTGRVLFRNSRQNIDGFPQRHLTTYALSMPPIYRERMPAMSPDERLTPEREFDDDWLGFDPRAEWLAEWLRTHRADKTLLICAESDTAQALEAWLRLRRGIRSAVFHDGLDLVQRDRAAAYFADPDEDAELLVCSEIAGEGRNFQFARNLVLFDLPLSPDLLEQRIGRLDRIGQENTVEIHVPIIEHSATAVWAQWLHHGIDAFEHVCPAGSALFAEFADEIAACMERPDDAPALRHLISRTTRRTAELLERLQRGRDRLLELNAFDRKRADSIIAAIDAAAHSTELRTYLAGVFDEFGVIHEDNGPASEIVQPGNHMSCDAFPGLPDGGLTVCFERDLAQAREDMHFLTWEHPMVTGAMEMVLGSEFGNTSFGAVASADLAVGTAIVECMFVIVCPAPKGLKVDRFLSQSALRLVVSSAGGDVADRCTAEWIDRAIRPVPVGTARKVLAHLHDSIETLVDQANRVCEHRQEAIIADADAKMRNEMDLEIERLRHLASINPNVRAEEVTALENDRDAYARYLDSAQLKLDAVRVAVATAVRAV